MNSYEYVVSFTVEGSARFVPHQLSCYLATFFNAIRVFSDIFDDEVGVGLYTMLDGKGIKIVQVTYREVYITTDKFYDVNVLNERLKSKPFSFGNEEQRITFIDIQEVEETKVPNE